MASSLNDVGWLDNPKACTRAFEQWRNTDRDIRAYLGLGLTVMERVYGEIWEEVANEPSSGEGPDLPDVFHKRVEGIWFDDFQWMFLSGGLRDAVTVYEVYLEQAMEEVLSHNGYTIRHFTNERSLAWGRLVAFYEDGLGVSIEGHEVARVRTIRHILVHKRGELRTEDQRSRYGTVEDFGISREVRLELQEVMDLMDTLAASVSVIDPVAWESSWGRNPPSALATFLAKAST